MVYLKGITCSLLLGPKGKRRKALEVGEPIIDLESNETTSLLEVEEGEFAIDISITYTESMMEGISRDEEEKWRSNMYFQIRICADGLDIIDRINRTPLNRNKTMYRFLIMEDTVCQDRYGRWCTRRFTFKSIDRVTFDPENKDGAEMGQIKVVIERVRYVEVLHVAELEVKGLNENMPSISKESAAYVDIKHVFCLGPEEGHIGTVEEALSRKEKSTNQGHLGYNVKVEHLDPVDRPYVELRLIYRAKDFVDRVRAKRRVPTPAG
ncbi:hypothetical protein EJ08DRAFT_240636 [Tothia fuscella]|uniref:Uncharacterized protein n=1 Tax=Tothia fuscella TaxID=1048955 RepID=A0A9P4NSB6_9PEZI|nr:hypothetical protein EJ08DRAFT_240636 [Tothia fuscella]